MSLSVRVQVVVYGHSPQAVANVVASVAASARRAAPTQVTLAFGDSSPTPVLDDETVLHDPAESEGLAAVTYQFFGANLGSAGGSNLLAKGATEDIILILNPDTYATPNLVTNL